MRVSTEVRSMRNWERGRLVLEGLWLLLGWMLQRAEASSCETRMRVEKSQVKRKI